MKVFTMRAPSESGADSGAEMEGDTGESGAAAMVTSCKIEDAGNSSTAVTQRQASQRKLLARRESVRGDK